MGLGSVFKSFLSRVVDDPDVVKAYNSLPSLGSVELSLMPEYESEPRLPKVQLLRNKHLIFNNSPIFNSTAIMPYKHSYQYGSVFYRQMYYLRNILQNPDDLYEVISHTVRSLYTDTPMAASEVKEFWKYFSTYYHPSLPIAHEIKQIVLISPEQLNFEVVCQVFKQPTSQVVSFKLKGRAMPYKTIIDKIDFTGDI